MRVLTLGAGTVGHWIADVLCRRRHDVTVIDTDAERVRQIDSELDVRAIHGNAAHSSVLFQADVFSADICLAVTGDDEANVVSASMAKALGARRSIARVYAPVFREASTFDYQTHFGIDSLLSLEQLSAFELVRAIRNPDAIPLEHFARGHLEVYEVEVESKASAVGVRLRELRLPGSVRIGSIQRDGEMWIASAEDEIHGGDRISMIGVPSDLNKSRAKFTTVSKRRKRNTVLIAGGGEIGFHLARALPASDYRTTILEYDPRRCEQLAKLLPDLTIVNASANNRSVLEDEGGGAADYFVACTGGDESNIMACVEARELGARRVMAVVGRPDYANVVGKLGIDHVVSERDTAARQILGFLNEGPIISHRRLPNGNIGVYELEVVDGAPVTEATLADLPFAGRCLITAIQRDSFIRVPMASDQLKPGDIVVALVDQQHASDCMALFGGRS
ncbi:Trk system potassium transporter TrkA [Roseiconus lacunae]|uniref:Trk system potassium transporter TrkA n=1 Tax=Roseiconus lacunae TaxID=2605694 RepID=UPI0030930433|nr:Trk system potassium transporter TrkA [Stieleria sp. HD01]